MMEVPSIPMMQDVAEVLEARAALDARAGRSDAYRPIVTLMKIADHVEQHFAFSVLMRDTLHGVAFEALRTIAQGAGLQTERLT